MSSSCPSRCYGNEWTWNVQLHKHNFVVKYTLYLGEGYNVPCRTPHLEVFFSLLLSLVSQFICQLQGGKSGRNVVFLDFGGYASTKVQKHYCLQEHGEETIDDRFCIILRMKTFMFPTEDMIDSFNNSMGCQGSEA